MVYDERWKAMLVLVLVLALVLEYALDRTRYKQALTMICSRWKHPRLRCYLHLRVPSRYGGGDRGDSHSNPSPPLEEWVGLLPGFFSRR